MKEFKPIKLKMKYDSIDLEAGDIVTAKSLSEYNNLCSRGAQNFTEKEPSKEDVKKEAKRLKDAQKKKEKEEEAEAKKKKEDEDKALKASQKDLKSSDKNLDKE